MNSVTTPYDNFFDPSALVAGVGNIVGGIGGAFSAKSQAKADTAIAREQGKTDVAKAFYGLFGKTDTSGLSSAANNVLGASLAKKQTDAEVKKAKEKKYMYISIAAAVMLGLGVALYFFLNKPTPAP